MVPWREGPEVEHFGVDEAHHIEDLDEVLPGLVDGHETVYLPIGRWPSLDEALARACARLRRSNREGKTPPRRLGEVADLLGEERIIKDDGALASLRRAVDITAEAHVGEPRTGAPLVVSMGDVAASGGC